MTTDLIQVRIAPPLATVALNDPARRNAMGLPMFDALTRALSDLETNQDVHVVLLRGEGPAFSAGFDLAEAFRDPGIMATLIERLSALLRRIRRLPQVTVAAVNGAAIAGGCAMVSACDLVVVSATAKLGYPVHRLGVSPAVTTRTLQASMGPGPARALLLGGALIDGDTAYRRGLADRLSADDETVGPDATALCEEIAGHGAQALRATKSWLNELEGALDDSGHDGPMRESATLAMTDAAQRVLRDALEDRFS